MVTDSVCCLYSMVKDTFVQPIIDSHLQDYDENHVEDFIAAYIRDMRSDRKKHLTQYVNGETRSRVITSNPSLSI